jgi:putative membrane protein
MTRAKFDQPACDSLAACVKEIEQNTDAELVIVVRGASGNYRHADYLCGAVLAFIGLLVLLFLPVDFHTYWVPIDVLVLFAGSAWLCSRSKRLRRLLTSKKYRATTVRTGAAAMFYEAGIANTSAEMGLLVYLSLLERRLELIADRGILKAVPPMEWNQILFQLKEAGRHPDVPTLLQGLRNLGALLGEHVPATGENPNELPDMPRIEL